MIEAVVTIALAIAGIAMLAVLVSSRAQTANVIAASGSSLSEALQSAEAPVLSSAEFPGVSAYY